MADIRQVTDAFAVAAQLSEEDVAAIAAAGFKTILCNRPDGEGGPMQPKSSAIRAKAESLGLTFVALPFSGAPTPEIVSQMAHVLNDAPQPVLAYCRTGTRSITAWALTHAGQGAGEEIVDAAAGAGYDLSNIERLL
ncbi:MAG: TIGR01244 family sulfur transferase [Hyphomonas sp.]|uniref:TIGR01244 family sulfur transferase n=1 Tax=Hyphomonas sp. TaxID=87 RepID=UPI00352720AB